MSIHYQLLATVKNGQGAAKRFISSRVAPPYTQLYIIGDGAPWVLNNEARELHRITTHLEISSSLVLTGSDKGIRRQSVFYTSRFVLNKLVTVPKVTNRIALPYYHGKPRSQYPDFVRTYEALKLVHPNISRIQVSSTLMRDVILDSGIEPSKVHLIPIGINLNYFPLQTAASKRHARLKYGIPQSAAVIGSFQKDGNGWGEGLTPKLIKGPDVLLKVLDILRYKISNLYVLLSGPARGYVKHGLNKLGIPFKHVYLKDYSQMAEFYHAADLTLITSREEGGPKAVLESMASGVPLVTTRVGQASDIVRHGENGWMVEVEDIEGLAYWAEHVLVSSHVMLESVRLQARKSAEQNSYHQQLPLWERFFKGFVTANVE